METYMRLKAITELAVNNKECVVLKVKDGHRMDLVSLGCCDGDEEMFRLTKGETVTCTVFYKNGNQSSWHWGYGGYTLVSPQTEELGRLVQNTIQLGFGITCEY